MCCRGSRGSTKGCFVNENGPRNWRDLRLPFLASKNTCCCRIAAAVDKSVEIRLSIFRICAFAMHSSVIRELDQRRHEFERALLVGSPPVPDRFKFFPYLTASKVSEMTGERAKSFVGNRAHFPNLEGRKGLMAQP